MAPLTRYKGQYLKAKMNKWNQIDEAKLAARVWRRELRIWLIHRLQRRCCNGS